MRKNTFTIIVLLSILTLQNCKRDYNSNDEEEIELVEANDHLNPKPNLESVNFYLENSASMDAYSGTGTNFTRALTSLLGSLERKFVPEDSIKINVIASEKFKINKSVYDFNEGLTVNGVPKIGNRETSDLNEIIELILKENNENQISILVTDAIYSVKLGNREPNCDNLIGLLDTESEKTQSVFSKRLKLSNLSTLILKMSSRFNGNYYPAQGGIEKIDQDRPYYVWFFGNGYNLKELYNKLELNDFSGYTNDFFIPKTNSVKIDYSILEYGEGILGEFENLNYREYPIHSIDYKGVDKFDETKGQFGFAIAVDLSEIPLPDQYFSEINNYRVSSSDYNPYRIESIADGDLNDETINAIRTTESEINSTFTHVIFVKTNQQYIQSFDIALKNKLSDWIQRTGLDCDNKIKGDTNKTFGFDRLAKGILKAYTEIDPEQTHFKIKLTVTKS